MLKKASKQLLKKEIVIAMFFFVILWHGESYAFADGTKIMKITLQNLYIDGGLSEEILFKEVSSETELLSEYKDWDLVWQSDKEMVFQKSMNDISPTIKENGYFGITEDGTLSIFNGKPSAADVIQSFFHIDVDLLEVKKQNELVEGIRIKDKKQYEEVLETFKPFMY